MLHSPLASHSSFNAGVVYGNYALTSWWHIIIIIIIIIIIYIDIYIYIYIYLLNHTCKFFQTFTHYKATIDVQIKENCEFLKQDKRSYELAIEASEVT